MLTLLSFKYNFKSVTKRKQNRDTDDVIPVKLGRTCVILSPPTIYYFFKKLGTSSMHKVSPLNCKDMPAQKIRA